MKRILRSFFLLLLVIVWSSNALAVTSPYSYTFKSGDFSHNKKTSTLNGVNWTLAVDSWKGNEGYAWDNTKGLKIGSGNKNCPNNNVTITTSEITGTIKSVTVNCSTNSGASTQLKVLVGGTQMGKQVSLTNSPTNYDFTGSAKGTIVLSFSDSSTPLYLKSINVVFEDGPTKTATTLTFTNSTIDIEEGNEANFAAQTATLKTGETVLNKVVTYTTNNDAMFEAYEANVGPKALKVGAYGTAVVTAKFAGDDTYAASTATYTVNYTEKVKPATTLDFGFATKSVNINESFTAPATLKAGEAAISGAVTYTSSKTEVATVDKTTGEVSALTAGTTKITATFAGTSEYKSSTAYYELTVVDPNAPLDNIVFDAATKGFDDMIETYKYPSGTNNAAFKTKDGKTYAFSYRNCMRNNAKGNNPDVIQMRNNKVGMGTFTSPVFDEMPNGYKVNVYYGISEGNKPLTITSNEETSATSISNAYGDKNRTDGTGYCTSIILANGSSFTVNVGGSTCYVSKIEILPLSAPITLDEAADDTDTKIENNKGKTVDVTLTRTLTAGAWNTICLPFDVTAEQIANVLKSEGNVKEYGSEDASKQTIYFKDATTMVAGKPYLIKPTEDAKELVFKGMTIKNVDAVDRKVGDKYKMCGVFGKYAMNTNGTELFLKTDGKFYVPAEGKETMKGFRAYFLVPTNTAAAALNLSFGAATGIDGIAADAEKNVKVYNVNGQYVGTSIEALPKGLYIVGGKKVLK